MFQREQQSMQESREDPAFAIADEPIGGNGYRRCHDTRTVPDRGGGH